MGAFTYPVCESDGYFYEKYGYYKWSAEELGRAHKWCEDKCRRAMMDATPRIVVSNTATRERDLKVYMKMAEEFGYRVTVTIVENRHGGKSIHNVPEEAVQSMEDRFSVKLR